MNLPAFSPYEPASVVAAEAAATEQARVWVRPPAGFAEAHVHAGQFCRVRVGGHEGIFAMASAPGRTPVEFLVRVGGDGGDAADRMAGMHAGGDIEMSLPAGTGFSLSDDEEVILCVATGTGVAPVCAAIDARLERDAPSAITLIHGVQTPAHVAIHEAIARWAKSGVKTRLCFSRFEGGALVGETVQSVLSAEHPDLRDATVLAVGQPAMVDALRTLATQLGLPASRFLTNL
ncbi:MAG: hypothetical protein AB8I08_33535 [Sandaracinaceae bacterium]